MADRIELYATKDGGEHTIKSDEMKTQAWKAAEDLGIKDQAKMSYSSKTGAFAMTFDGAAPEKVAEFTEKTAQFRTDEAKAESAAKLPETQAVAAAERAEKGEKPPVEKAPKEPKEPELPRTNVAIYPIAVEPAEGQDLKKAASSSMAKAAEGVIDGLGLKDSVKVSYNIQESNWQVGGRGLSDDSVKALQDGLAQYRTPELEAAWRSNAPVKDATAKDTGAKGPAEGPDVASAAKDVGAGR